MAGFITTRRAFLVGAASLLTGCASSSNSDATPLEEETELETEESSIPSSVERETISDDTDGGHAIEADGIDSAYQAVDVFKTGEADGDEADFYGVNAAVFATNGASLTLEDVNVTSDGTHANAIFSYGEGTTVEVSNSIIETSGNCSGGLMVTGGGTLNATNLDIHTTGNSSAAIRSDRGGGTEIVSGGSYLTEGTGSPVIYSTADVHVSDAALESCASQGVVVEGRNSVTLENCALTASNTAKNSDKSSWYQAVMIYQSMSGDAAEGTASFSMRGGSLENANGDILFVNNTSTTVELEDVRIENNDTSGVFLRAAAAGWGSEGSNGGNVTLNAVNQEILGDMLVDDVSSLNLVLDATSSLNGTINPEGAAGKVYVELAEGARWTLTANANITSLTCAANCIDLNGYTLMVDGTAYTQGSESTGEAIVVETTSSGGGPGGTPPDGGLGGQGGPGGGTPPAKP